MRKAEKIVLFKLLNDLVKHATKCSEVFGEEHRMTVEAGIEAHGVRRAIGKLGLYPEYLDFIGTSNEYP